MHDYSPVLKALSEGTQPAMLCATCPWPRNCINPPVMTRTEVTDALAEARQADEANKQAAVAAGLPAPAPAATLLAMATIGDRDVSAMVCPVLALRLQSSGGGVIAAGLKTAMQDWDDSK
jgi:hypothetical protein